jgi:hypothetical protein
VMKGRWVRGVVYLDPELRCSCTLIPPIWTSHESLTTETPETSITQQRKREGKQKKGTP